MKRLLIGAIMCLLFVVGVYAIVTPINPTTDDITNADAYDFTATSTNPFAAGGLHIDLDLGGTPLTMVCANTPPDYDCSLLAYDISGLEGVYPVTMTDIDGPLLIGDLTVDHAVTANDFGFSAADFIVTYAVDCDCTPSGCDPATTGEYSFELGPWTSFVSGNDFTVVDGPGDYEFRGYCKDLAGNEDWTAVTAFTLPASPPVLIEAIDLPITVVCQEPGVSCASPVAYGPLDGLGLPLDVALKVTFDKDASITLTLDGGAPVGPSGFFIDHVISLGSVTEGNHSLLIDASDGTNSAIYEINIEVLNTGGTGDIIIDIRDPIEIDPTDPAIMWTGAVVEKNDILPGDFAIVRYELFMIKGAYTRFGFSGDIDFEAPITVFCEDNYDPILKDIITPGVNDYNIDVLDGTIDTSKPSITCPIKTGDVDSGMYYDVLVKYPISETSAGGSLSGSLVTDLYTECENGLDDDLDAFIDFPDDLQCVDILDNDESI